MNREFGIEGEEIVKLPKGYKEQLQVLLEENVPVVSFAFQTLEKEEINDLKKRNKSHRNSYSCDRGESTC